MAFKFLDSAQARWRALTARHLVALVRAGASFEKGEAGSVSDQIGGAVEQAVPNNALAVSIPSWLAPVGRDRRPADPHAQCPSWSRRSGLVAGLAGLGALLSALVGQSLLRCGECVGALNERSAVLVAHLVGDLAERADS